MPAAQTAPVGAPATAPASAPVGAAPVASPSSAAPPPAAPPSAAPPPAAPPPTADASLTPRQVIHDQSGVAAPAEPAAPGAPSHTSAPQSAPQSPPQSLPYVARQTATLPPAANSGGLFITGPVVSAAGNIYQNYEVQRGEHIDELARNFSTTRDALLDV